MTDLVLGQEGISDKVYNIRGNAWDIANSAFGKVLDPSKGDYQMGDIIVFSRPSFASDARRGIPDQDQHVGIITGFDQRTGEPIITHYIPRKNEDAPFTRQPLSQTSINLDGTTIQYKPSKIVRLNVNSNINTPDYTKYPSARVADKNWIHENENYGLNVNAAIAGLNKIQNYEQKYQITPNEDIDLKLATLAMLGLESDFGGSKRSMLRNSFPTFTNLLKELKRKSIELPSVGYGSIKPEIVFQNTSFPDLDKALKEGKITRQQHYKITHDRIATLKQVNDTSFGLQGNLMNLAFNYRFDRELKPDTRLSYQGALANYNGFDTRGVGQSIENDAQLIYSNLVGLHKKYPELSAKDLVSRLRGSKMNDIDSKKYDELIRSFTEGNYTPSLLNKVFQKVQFMRDTYEQQKRDAENKILRKIVPGANFKSAVTDFNQDRADIDENFFNKSEYNALVDLVSQAVRNNRSSLGYTTSESVQGYTPEGQALSGGTGSTFKSITKNFSDPYTRLQNMLGQASITQDKDNYYIEDEYDFNNFGSLNNVNQGIIRNPQPYAVLRSTGTVKGSAPGVGRKVKIKIPKSLIRK